MERLTRRNSNGEAIAAKVGYYDIIEKLAEYEDLEEHNLLLKLPCKVGDEVYILNDIVDTEKCKNCDFYYAGGMGDYPACHKTKYGFRAVDCIDIDEEAIFLKNILYCLSEDMFGKKVFLTKEEAEKALAEMKGE